MRCVRCQLQSTHPGRTPPHSAMFRGTQTLTLPQTLTLTLALTLTLTLTLTLQ